MELRGWAKTVVGDQAPAPAPDGARPLAVAPIATPAGMPASPADLETAPQEPGPAARRSSKEKTAEM